jgi:hypothetical protein
MVVMRCYKSTLIGEYMTGCRHELLAEFMTI